MDGRRRTQGHPPGSLDGVNSVEIFYTVLLIGLTGAAGLFGLYVLYRLKG